MWGPDSPKLPLQDARGLAATSPIQNGVGVSICRIRAAVGLPRRALESRPVAN